MTSELAIAAVPSVALRRSFHGDRAQLRERALATFTQLGFRVEALADDTLVAHGPGMNSNQQPALLGAKTIRIRFDGQDVLLDADLEGLESLRRLLRYMPLMLGLGLGLLFALLFRRPEMLLFTLVPVAPWFFIGPPAVRRLEANTRAALDAFLANVAL